MAVKKTKNKIKKNINFKDKIETAMERYRKEELILKLDGKDEPYVSEKRFDNAVNQFQTMADKFYSIKQPTDEDKSDYISNLENMTTERFCELGLSIKTARYYRNSLNNMKPPKRRNVVKDTLNQHPFICSFSIGFIFILAYNGVSDFIHNRKLEKNG